MCAIIGWAGKIDNTTLRELVKNAEQRGPHSMGLAFDEASGSHARHINHPTVNVLKRAVSPSFFLRRHYRRVRRAAAFELGFAHVRWATHGHVIDQNAHPFDHPVGGPGSAGKRLIFCHNGVIHNYLDFKPDAVVDSECFGPLLERREPGLARGSTGLCWFEVEAGQANKLCVYRRSQNLKAFTFGRNGEVFTLIASLKNIIPSELFLLPHFETTLEEGVAYQVLPGGLRKMWDDKVISTTKYQYQTRYAAASQPVDEDTAGAAHCAAHCA